MANVPVQIIPPTGVDFILLVNENIITNFLLGLASNITVPTIYRRAYLLVNASDKIAVTRVAGQGT